MRRVLWIAAVGMLLSAGFARPSVAAADGVRGVCSGSPAAALLTVKGSAGANLVETHGYRVESVRWDPLLRQSWAVVQSCDHPEQPAVAMRMGSTAPLSQAISTMRPYASVPMVRAGDMVRLWKSESRARIEMVAISEENGAVGTRVRLRLAVPRDMEGQFSQSGQPQYLAGVVRGPDDVEMEP